MRTVIKPFSALTRWLGLPLLAACLCSFAAAQSPKAPLTKVRVGILNSLGEAPTFLADERGYFREEGIEISFERFDNTADMSTPMITGDLDVASGAPTLGLLNGSLRGLPFMLVADKGRNSKGHGFNAIVVRKDLIDSGRVKTIADLKGLKVASPSRNSPMEFQLDTALRASGSKLEDVSIEQMGFPSMLQALSNKAVDAALLIEPFVANASKRQIATRLLGFDETSPNFQIAGIIYAPEFVKRKPEIANKWMVAYLRGVRDYLDAIEGRSSRQEMFTALGKQIPTFKDPVALANVVFPGFDPDGYLHLPTIVDSIDWYSSRGLLQQKPKLADLVDYQYIEYAHKRLGRKGPAQPGPK